MARLLLALHLWLLANARKEGADHETCEAVKTNSLLQKPLSGLLDKVQLAAAEETKDGDDSFEAARPGSCCPEEPTMHVPWSTFATSAAFQEAQAQGAPIVVPCGHEVTVDQSAAGLHGLRVLGSLNFQEGVDVVLETDHVFICGRFSIGSNASAHTAKVEIVLTGSTEVQWPTADGGKSFGKAPFATFGGELYIRGAACGARTWTWLSEPVAPVERHLTNVALKQPAASSSVGHWRYGAEKGVDGGTNWKGQSVLTGREANPWWYVRVDSLADSGVATVLLTRRLKYGSDLGRVTVGVAGTACQKGALCGGHVCQNRGSQAGKQEFDCGGAAGAFVYVQLQGQDYLSFSEAEVFPSTDDAEYILPLQEGPAVSWRPGDRLMITATGYNAEETEEVTVVSMEPGRARVSGRLRHAHAGCDRTEEGCVMAAEVASLSRNVVIRGRDGCGPDCGHFMLAHTNRGFVCGAEFTNLGQTEVEGRYPLHIHLPGDAPDLVVRDNALHDNLNRGLVMHGVHSMRVEGNTCYRTKGHCFMTEDGVEQHNRVVGNLGVLVYPQHFGCSQSHDMSFMCAHRSDNSPNAFWISNPNNIFDGNVGVTNGGAFFIETRHVMGLVRRKFRSEAVKVGHNGKIKGRVPLAQFTNNLAHSCGAGLGNYPRVGFPAGGRNAYEGFTAWRCGSGMGAHTGGSRVTIRQAHLVENTVAVTAGHPTNRIAIYESRLIARSGWEMWNKGTRYTSAPLIMNRMGKTQGSQLRGIFTVDAFTRKWVRCHGGYDPDALAFRGDWFALFRDPAGAEPCTTEPGE